MSDQEPSGQLRDVNIEMALTDLRIGMDMLGWVVTSFSSMMADDVLFELGRVFQKLHEAEMSLDLDVDQETIRHEAGMAPPR